MRPSLASRCRGAPIVLALLALAHPGVAPAQAGPFATVIECVLFVGGRPSQTESIPIDSSGFGGGRLFFERNVFVAMVRGEATPSAITVEVDIERHQRHGGTDITVDFSRSRAGNTPGQTLGSASVTNGRIACHTR